MVRSFSFASFKFFPPKPDSSGFRTQIAATWAARLNPNAGLLRGLTGAHEQNKMMTLARNSHLNFGPFFLPSLN